MTEEKNRYLPLILGLAIFILYFLSNPLPGKDYDYTFRIAGALLDGRLGLVETPPEWLNEMVPHEGRYYSVFPLGAILTMLPLGLLERLGILAGFPGTAIAALTAAICGILFYLLAGLHSAPPARRIFLALFPVLGTWMWANLAFAGAWHIALGLAIAGQMGALYFLLVRFHPLAAGACFALAFGNRTELLLLAPLFFYLIFRKAQQSEMELWGALDRFVSIPILLGALTLVYNYARFSSPFDFGYARIPGVLNEPWYQHGIFSIHAIPGNVYAMLLEPWQWRSQFPYLVPGGFGGSIFLSCPLLVFLFRRGAQDPILKYLAWAAIGLLTLILWCHGNPGGWQISYRYAIELLPWAFLIFLETTPPRVSRVEWALLFLSIAINAYSAYLFLRTKYIGG